MNISMKWLRDYVDLDETMDVKTYCDAMTMSGTKVEAYETLGQEIKKVVVGKIISIEPHPDADKLVVTKVDVGDQVLQIVTGAKNISVNDYVPVALHGAELADGVKIKKGKLRGIESNGMMCSVEELGLSREDFSEAPEHGIYLFDQEKPLGADVKPYFGLDDTVVEYEITSNRSDSFSVIGVAREAAATFEKSFALPGTNYSETKGNINDHISVSVEDASLCYRYMGKIVTDVTIKESPKWMKDRLRSCGIRPINNLVDITNFIMQEYGQPMHAYDLDLLEKPVINVRRAKSEETLTTLDGEEHTLDENILVIADDTHPIGAAGIMGGNATKVLDSTKTIFFEAATFNGTIIRKGAKKLGLRTDASTKFEKHLDPNLAKEAMERACHLIELLGAGKIMEGVIDIYPNPRQARVLNYDVEAINKIIGIKATEEDMVTFFERLQFKVDTDSKTVSIPTNRFDIEGMADLAEEVARLYGYNNIPVTLASGTPTVGAKTKKQQIEDAIKRIMEACGISEAMTYSFESPKVYDRLLIPKEHPLRQYIRLQNPLGEDFSVMRTLTVNAMMNALSTNASYRNHKVRLYEIGRTYIAKSFPLEDYPMEQKYLTIGMYDEADFFSMKGIIETVLSALGIKEDLTYKADIDMPFLHPGRKAEISYKDQVLGYLGEVHPETSESYNIDQRCYIGVINVDVLSELANTEGSYEPVPRFPAMHRDLALLVKEDIPVGSLDFYIKQRGGKNLESYELFDVYQGEQIEEGYKSVAYSLTFRAKDHTLDDAEVTKSMTKILAGLEHELGVTLRQ